MRGIVIAALLGTVAGAAAVDAALRERVADPEVSPAGRISDASPRARQRRGRSDAAGSFSAQTRVYARILAADLGELARDFDAAAESPLSQERDERLAATLAALAEHDVNAALEALTRHTFGRRTAHVLALAFLDGTGITYENAMAVAAVLPALDRVRFATESASALAIESPDDALAFAQEFEAKLERMRAIAAVADVVAERDPYSAMRMAETIPLEPGVLFRPDRRVFQMVALRHLARASFVTATEYATREIRAVPSMTMRMDFLRILQSEAEDADPLAVLEATRLLDDDGARWIESTAIERLAHDSPLDALAYVDDLPGFAQRMRLRQQVAQIYGERDPEAALAWVGSQDEATARLMVHVLNGVARTDPLRALDVVLTSDQSNERIGVVSGFGTTFMGRDQYDIIERAINPDTERPANLSHEDLIAQIGERLLAIPDSDERRSWIDRYVMTTARYDPAAALTFANDNPGQVQRWIYSNLAQHFRSDPLEAMDYVDLVPEEMRPAWVHSVANTMAERDPAAAVEWVEQYRGQGEFASLAGAVVARTVRTDPAAALNLLASLPLEGQVEAARGISGAWAESDPIAARAWVETLPPGPYRDAAVPGLLSQDWGQFMQSGATMPLDPTLLALFSSDAARQEAVAQIAEMVGRRRPAAAQALLDEHVTDPVLRVHVETRIANMAGWP